MDINFGYIKKKIEKRKTLTMDDFIHQQFGDKLLGQPSVKGGGLLTCPIKTNKNKILKKEKEKTSTKCRELFIGLPPLDPQG